MEQELSGDVRGRGPAAPRHVQRPQVLALGGGRVELRVRVSMVWFVGVAHQARAEAATAGQLVQEALESLLPPDQGSNDGQSPVVGRRTRSGSWSVLSREERRRLGNGQSFLSRQS